MAKKNKKINTEEMKKVSKRNIAIMVGAVLICLVVVLVGSYNLSNSAKYEEPLDTVKSLINNQFFDNGTYEDYINLFLYPNRTMSEKSYNDYRKKYSAKDFFKWDYQSVNSIMTHMKVDKVSSDKVKVYYLKDIKDKNEMEKSNPWILDYSNGSWLIEN